MDDGSTDGTRELLRTALSEASACFGVRAFEGHTSHSFLYVAREIGEIPWSRIQGRA